VPKSKSEPWPLRTGDYPGSAKRDQLDRIPRYWPTFQYHSLAKPVSRRAAFVGSPVVSDGSMTLSCPRWRLCGKLDRGCVWMSGLGCCRQWKCSSLQDQHTERLVRACCSMSQRGRNGALGYIVPQIGHPMPQHYSAINFGSDMEARTDACRFHLTCRIC